MAPPSTKVTKVVLVSPNTPITNCDGNVEFAASNLTIWSDGLAAGIKDDSTAGVGGSRRVASVDVAYATTNLIVTLALDPNYRSVPFHLMGVLNGATVVNASQCYVGSDNTVPLPSKHAGIPWGYAGDVQWHLRNPQTQKQYVLNSTRVEIYGLSSGLPAFLKNPAVPVEFLRYMALPEPKSDYRQWVATTCMTDFWFRYDTVSGRPRFASSTAGGSYKFSAWLSTMFTRVTVNCYDQAGIVQIANCLKEGNPTNTWAFLAPYGYINKTQLVGRGQCNNPFYQQQLAIRCIDEGDPRRTYFGNHAIIVLDGMAMDATCGPHTGNETLAAYKTSAIDQYPQSWTVTTTYSQGITGLNWNNSSSPTTTSESASPMDAVDRAMDRGLLPHPPALRFANADWSALPPLLAQQFSLREVVRGRTTDIGPSGSDAGWIFRHAPTDALCTLAVTLCADHAAAVRAMRVHLSAYAAPLDDVFARPPPADGAKGQIDLEGRNLSVWVRGDAFVVLDVNVDVDADADVDVDINAGGLDFKRLAVAIDGFLAASAVDAPEQADAPVFSGLPAPLAPVPLGSEFTIRLEASGVGLMNSVSTSGNTLRLSKDPFTSTFKFLALKPGEDEIVFYFAHPATLRTAKRTVRVTVQEAV